MVSTMQRAAPIAMDIVLVGGGHAHVHVLTNLAMRPLPGIRLTLIARDRTTPYSGMLPGMIAGLYTAEQAHIDLVRLAAATGTRLIHAEANGIDRANNVVVYHRWGDDDQGRLERFYVVLNFSQFTQQVSFEVPDAGPWMDLISGHAVTAASGQLNLEIGSNWGAIYFRRY